MNLLCYLFGHKLKTTRVIGFVRELTCTRCKAEFCQHDRLNFTLPLDEDFKQINERYAKMLEEAKTNETK